MRNKILPLFIFFGIVKLNSASGTDDPGMATSDSSTVEQAQTPVSIEVPTGLHGRGQINQGLSPVAEYCQPQTEGGTPSPSPTGWNEVTVPSVSLSSETEESKPVFEVQGGYRVKNFLSAPILSDNGESVKKLRGLYQRLFNETSVFKMASHSELADAGITMTQIEVSEGLNLLLNPLDESSKFFAVHLPIIQYVDAIWGKVFLYDPKNPVSFSVPKNLKKTNPQDLEWEDTAKLGVNYRFTDENLPTIDNSIKSAMHLISPYLFDLCPCKVYSYYKVETEEDETFYSRAIIVIRDNQENYLLTKAGAEKLDYDPIDLEKVISPSYGNLHVKDEQPIHLFSVNLCGEIYFNGNTQKEIEHTISEEGLVGKGVEILGLLMLACNNPKKHGEIEFGQGSIISKMPVVGPLQFFGRENSKNLKQDLIDSLEDVWSRFNTKKRLELQNLSDFISSTDPDSFEKSFDVEKPNFSGIAQNAINIFYILFKEAVTKDFKKLVDDFKDSNIFSIAKELLK